eukprot:719595-Rhodomonas_salina.1
MAADTFNNYTVSEDKFRTMVDFCNEDPGFPAYRGIVGPEEESRDRQAPCGSGCEAGGQGRGACSREQTPPRLRPRQEARHRGSDCILDKMVAAAPVAVPQTLQRLPTSRSSRSSRRTSHSDNDAENMKEMDCILALMQEADPELELDYNDVALAPPSVDRSRWRR